MSTGLLPGVRLPGRPAGHRPDVLRHAGPVLLDGVRPGTTRGWRAHLSRHGSLPSLGLPALADAAEGAGLQGFGGAAFPTAAKLRSMPSHRSPLVVVNGAEGEQASAKDGVLLRHVPQLVLDGALLVAHALGAPEVVVRVANDRPDLPDVITRAAAERPQPRARVTVSVGPATFAAGESSAVINGISGRPPLPGPLGRPPRTPASVLGRRRPVFLSNVETLARLALAARGTTSVSALLTVSGAVGAPGVVELPTRATLADAVTAAGAASESVAAAVTGGWHGRWLDWSAAVQKTPLTRDGLAAVGGRWGAGIVVVVPAAVCPLAVVASVAGTLAEGSAGQCGPCRVGLPFVAAELRAAARGAAPAGPAVVVAEDALASLRGRGLCAHPTAAGEALLSALAWAETDRRAHASGRCLVAGARP